MTLSEIKALLIECQKQIREIPSDLIGKNFQDEMVMIESSLRRSLMIVKNETKFETNMRRS